MKPTLVHFSETAELFEGPIFDSKHKLLYFVSILDGLTFCYNPETKEILSIKLDSPSSNIYVIDFKKVLVASKNGFYNIDFNTLKAEFAFQIDIAPNVRYNDGIVDPKGRYIIGTMGYPEVIGNIGKVYSYSNGISKVIIENTTISNGLAFAADQKSLFFIDTPTQKVAKYHYDIETGDVNFDSYVIKFTNEGNPDGMTIDKDGMLWIAEWNGYCVSQWNPNTGEKLNEIKLPYKNVTSCCFDNNSNLYITTAKEEDVTENNGSGLFYVELNKF
ncbi:MAG: SMP-30/gluconolactonase/LRE family protein [Winogradskyella sp.]|uniref:SMP-30/gluconolactonase/LRE family protein n=1 Tax=Winogradskyella sp. TaxID=1883156 RepID=UPI0025E48610|nr:SMP-30/gluconolactonase/LRE family protein [Winogradskyella sp.]NRB59199.1 SMP-30/gluconolactonase/LRE family protein [Winogradskyella sp.]